MPRATGREDSQAAAEQMGHGRGPEACCRRMHLDYRETDLWWGKVATALVADSDSPHLTSVFNRHL